MKVQHRSCKTRTVFSVSPCCMPACWLYVAGYLGLFCQTLLDELDRLPGDSRMQIGFIAFDSVLYFYGLDPSFSQPKMFIVSDLDGNCGFLVIFLFFLEE